MIDFIIHALFFAMLLSLIMLPFILGLCKAAAKTPPPANGGTPPKTGANLDAPTLTRREIKQMREHGFEMVHPAPFDELRPLDLEPTEMEVEVTRILKP